MHAVSSKQGVGRYDGVGVSAEQVGAETNTSLRPLVPTDSEHLRLITSTYMSTSQMRIKDPVDTSGPGAVPRHCF